MTEPDHFRRRHDEEEEVDIFAPCGGYSDDEEESSEANDTAQVIKDKRSASDAELDTSTAEVEPDAATSDNARSRPCGPTGSQSPRNRSVRNNGRPRRQGYRAGTTDADTSFEGRPPSRRFLSHRRPPNKRTDQLDDKKDGQPSSPNNAAVSCTTNGLRDTSSNEQVLEAVETTQRSTRQHAAGRGRRRGGSSGGGRGGARGRGGRWGGSAGNAAALPRRACYFQHEDRLAEPDVPQPTQPFCFRADENDGLKELEQQNASFRGGAKTLKAEYLETEAGRQLDHVDADNGDDKWLHDRFEQLQDPNGLPLAASRQSFRRGRGRRSGAQGQRARGGRYRQRYAE